MGVNCQLPKFTERFPIGAVVLYCNMGSPGHGNLATIIHYLHRSGEPDRVRAVELQFKSGGLHIVNPNQLKKFYRIISDHKTT